MATSEEYMEFVCSQIKTIGSVRYKKMFGEYMVYINNKPIFLVCDSTVYIKKLSELDGLMTDALCGIPYNGAKEHYILDIDNKEMAEQAAVILEKITPLPKPRKKKNQGEKEKK